MAIPVGIATVLVKFGAYTSDTGTILSGTISVYTSRRLLWTATGDVLVPVKESLQLLPDGTQQIRLPATDQSGFGDGLGGVVKNWTYTADFVVNGQTWSTTFQLPTTPGTVDIDQLTPITASNGTIVAVPAVTSVNGMTGAVTVSGGSGSTTVGTIVDATALGKSILLSADPNAALTQLGINTLPATVANKADLSQVTAAVSDKATVTQLTSGLNGKLDAAKVNVASGVAPLGTDKLLPTINLTAGVPIVVKAVAGVFPPRPATTNPVWWKGPSPGPVGGGTTAGGGGAVDNVDDWIVTAS